MVQHGISSTDNEIMVTYLIKHESADICNCQIATSTSLFLNYHAMNTVGTSSGKYFFCE